MIESIAIFLANHPWWVASVMFVLQVMIAGLYTGRNLWQVRNIFSKNDQYAATGTPLCISVIQGNPGLNALVEELNDYLRKNDGTADYSIIQNKTERFVNSQFDKAVSRISFPTYIGLMGTFLGVMIGLGCFNATGGNEAGLVNDERIAFLIHGVLISMSTSFIGLLITTLSSHFAALVKSTVDERKGRFYEFIQNELIPELGTSIVSSLHKLRSTINRFEPAFNRVIDRFQETFDTCTSSFGEAFRQNVTVVANAVDTMGENMAVVNESIQNQQRILEELQSRRTQNLLRRFIDAADSFDHIGQTMNTWEETAHAVMLSSEQLVTAQTRYNESLELPRAVTDRLQSLLDRFVRFEESINQLGELDAFRISQLNIIQQQLDIISRRSAAVEDFTTEQKEELENLLKLYSRGMQDLQVKLQQAMNEQVEAIEQAQTDYQRTLEAQYASYLSALDDTFNSEEMAADFHHLKSLANIEEQLQQVQAKMSDKEEVAAALQQLEKTWKDTVATLAAHRSSYPPVPPAYPKGPSGEPKEEGNPYAAQAQPYRPSGTIREDQRPHETPKEVTKSPWWDKWMFWKKR